MKVSITLLACAGALICGGPALAQQGNGIGPGWDAMRNLGPPRLVPIPQGGQPSAAAKDCANADGKVAARRRVEACGKLIDSGKWKGHDIAWAYANRCVAYFKLGQRDKARADCDQALALDDGNAVAFETRGLIAQSGGDSAKALADFDKAVSLGAKSAALFVARGDILLAQGEADQALASYDQAIELDGAGAAPRVARGGAWLAKDDAGRAIEDYQKAIELAPGNGFAAFGLGLASYLKGDRSKAIDAFRQALRLDAANAYPALWLFLAQDGEEPKADLRQASAKFGGGSWPNPVMRYDLGALDGPGLFDAAKTPADQCEAQFYFGAERLKQGAREEARAALSKAVEICPKNFFEFFGARAGLKALAADAVAAPPSKAEPPAPAPAEGK